MSILFIVREYNAAQTKRNNKPAVDPFYGCAFLLEILPLLAGPGQ